MLLVSIDTLRADHLGAYGDTRGLSPNLDAFARDAVVFDHAWAQANTTVLSHASLFTSRMPSELTRVASSSVLPKTPPTLAEVLSVYGYATGGFTGGGMLDPCRGLDRGFGTFRSPGCTAGGTFYDSAPPALAWLEAQPAGTHSFVFVHGYDVHEPYLKPSPWGRLFDPGDGESGLIPEALQPHLVFGRHLFRDPIADPGIANLVRPWDEHAQQLAETHLAAAGDRAVALGDGDLARLRGFYAGGVAYADAWFGWMLERLRASGRLDHTVVIVLSDHGETLGEDGRFGHSHSLADAVTHVPLMIRVPGATPRHVAEDVELVDVLPTVLELAGATPPAGIVGSSLVPALHGGALAPRAGFYAEGNEAAVSWRTPEGRLTFAGVEASSPYLPLLLEAAPLDGPSFDQSTVPPAGRAALRDQLLTERKVLAPTPETLERVDAGVVEAMRRRGYWEKQQ